MYRQSILVVDNRFNVYMLEMMHILEEIEFTVSFLKAYLLPSPFALLSLLAPWRRYVLAPCV